MASRKNAQGKSVQRKAAKRKARTQRLKREKAITQAGSKLTVEERVNRALHLRERGDDVNAGKRLGKLLKQHPDNAGTHYGMGVFHILGDAFDEALPFLRRATEIKPDFVEAHYAMGRIYQNQFELKKMIIAFKKVIHVGEAGDETVEAARRFIDGFERHLHEESGIGIDEFLVANELFDQSFSMMEAEEWETAIPLLRKAIEINDSNPQPFGNLGICYANIGDRRRALHYLDKALAIDPNYAPAKTNRALVEKLADGEPLASRGKMATVDYYKDIVLKGGSLHAGHAGAEAAASSREKGANDADGA